MTASSLNRAADYRLRASAAPKGSGERRFWIGLARAVLTYIAAFDER